MRVFSEGKVVAILASTILLLAVACSKRRDDQTIAEEIQSKVAADPVAKDSAVQVTAKEGKVKLTGTAKDAAAQQKIEQIAHEEPGATGVDDETSVGQEVAAAGAPAPAPAPPPEAAKPKPQPIVVPAGTALTVITDRMLSSKTSQSGQQFSGTLGQAVTVNGKTAIPKGAPVTGKVVSAKAKGKIKGEGELVLSLATVTVRGRDYPVETGTLDSTVKGKGKRTAATTGGGAAGGALIGGLAGGGKGAGIGALIGGATGLVGGAMTGNKQIEIPAETPLTFTLASSLTLPPREE
jgi:hypothetical protein